MNTLQLDPLYRRSVGFDRFADLLQSLSSGLEESSPNYPPYDIEKYDEEQYGISMAVAGFSIDDLDITQELNELTVRGRAPEITSENSTFLHRGIACRDFVQRFRLADHVEVGAAAVDNGLLRIELKRAVPEAAKPRRISIQGKASTEVTQKKQKKQTKQEKLTSVAS